MNSKEQPIENQTLNITEEIRVRASLDATFAALLEEIGPQTDRIRTQGGGFSRG